VLAFTTAYTESSFPVATPSLSEVAHVERRTESKISLHGKVVDAVNRISCFRRAGTLWKVSDSVN